MMEGSRKKLLVIVSWSDPIIWHMNVCVVVCVHTYVYMLIPCLFTSQLNAAKDCSRWTHCTPDTNLNRVTQQYALSVKADRRIAHLGSIEIASSAAATNCEWVVGHSPSIANASLMMSGEKSLPFPISSSSQSDSTYFIEENLTTLKAK